MSYSPPTNSVNSEYIYSQETSLTNSNFIQSGWVDMQEFDKYQLEAKGSIAGSGFTLTIESSSSPSGTGSTVTSNTIVDFAEFFLFNIIVRQRYQRWTWTNNSGITISDAYLAIKGTKGSSDKLSVFPLAVSPSNFSQAALVQSVIKGQQPDGDYVNTPATGSAFTTTSNLGIGAIYESPWTDSDGWTDIELFIQTDVESAEQGIEIEFTENVQAITPTIRATKKYTFGSNEVTRGFLVIKNEPLLDGFRVRYTNGDTAQSNFLLDATLRVGTQGRQVNSANALLVSDYNTEIALGNVANYEIGTKFGRNPDIDTGPEDMWNGGSIYTGQPESFTPETVDVYSSSINDTSAGTGARTIRLFGLKSDSSTSYTSEDIILNGTTAVTSVNTWWRINRAYVLTAGTSSYNEGVITIEASTTSSNVFVQMPATFNQTTIGAYTVPAGKIMILKRIRVAITRLNGSAGSATITLRAREPGRVYRAIRVFELQTGSTTEFESLGGDILSSGTDIKYTIESVSDTNTVAEGAFEYILLDN